LLLCFFLFGNCFSAIYKHNFEPKSGDEIFLEFAENKIYPANIKKISDTELIVEVKNILRGTNRLLMIHLDLTSSRASLSEVHSKEIQTSDSGFTSLVYLQISEKLLFDNQHRYVALRELPFNAESLKNHLTVLQIFHVIAMVNLEKDTKVTGRYKKMEIPSTNIIYSDNLNWTERSRICWSLKKTAFYSGYIVTVPLDLITGIFQVIYYLAIGGGVK